MQDAIALRYVVAYFHAGRLLIGFVIVSIARAGTGTGI
jgi:hypothetical protein